MMRVELMPVHFRVRLRDRYGNDVPVRQLDELPKISLLRCTEGENHELHRDVTIPTADENVLNVSTAALTVAGSYFVTLNGMQVHSKFSIRSELSVDAGPPCARRCRVLGNTGIRTQDRTVVVRVQLRDRFDNLVKHQRQVKNDLQVTVLREEAAWPQMHYSTDWKYDCLACTFSFVQPSRYTLKVRVITYIVLVRLSMPFSL